MRVWLDDLREPPTDEWTWAKNVEHAKTLLSVGPVTHASLDNDLGEGLEEGRKLLLWMVEAETWPTEEISVHSANVVASHYMTEMIKRYGPFSRVANTDRFMRRPPSPGGGPGAGLTRS